MKTCFGGTKTLSKAKLKLNFIVKKKMYCLINVGLFTYDCIEELAFRFKHRMEWKLIVIQLFYFSTQYFHYDTDNSQ